MLRQAAVCRELYIRETGLVSRPGRSLVDYDVVVDARGSESQGERVSHVSRQDQDATDPKLRQVIQEWLSVSDNCG